MLYVSFLVASRTQISAAKTDERQVAMALMCGDGGRSANRLTVSTLKYGQLTALSAADGAIYPQTGVRLDVLSVCDASRFVSSRADIAQFLCNVVDGPTILWDSPHTRCERTIADGHISWSIIGSTQSYTTYRVAISDIVDALAVMTPHTDADTMRQHYEQSPASRVAGSVSSSGGHRPAFALSRPTTTRPPISSTSSVDSPTPTTTTTDDPLATLDRETLLTLLRQTLQPTTTATC